VSEFEWMRRSACLGVVNPMWDDNIPSADALRFCFRCPVRRDCAEYGIGRAYASDAGVLGGLSVQDRERVRDGVVTVEGAWASRLAELVVADWDEALGEDFGRDMPRRAA
jgi:hypothetical protein